MIQDTIPLGAEQNGPGGEPGAVGLLSQTQEVTLPMPDGPNSSTAFRVVGWDQNFENNRTRELLSMAWVPFPNRHDGDGYTELLDHEDGAAHFGAWVAIVQVASKCRPRGTLLRDGGHGTRVAHDSASLSRMTRIPVATIATATRRLVKVGWLEVISLETIDLQNPALGCGEVPSLAPQDAASSRARQNGREGKGIEGNGKTEDCAESSSPPPVMEFLTHTGQPWGMTPDKLAEYRDSFPTLDVLSECRKIRQWCIDNPKKRKTAKGMTAFIGRWLANAVDDVRSAPSRQRQGGPTIVATSGSGEQTATLVDRFSRGR